MHVRFGDSIFTYTGTNEFGTELPLAPTNVGAAFRSETELVVSAIRDRIKDPLGLGRCLLVLRSMLTGLAWSRLVGVEGLTGSGWLRNQRVFSLL